MIIRRENHQSVFKIKIAGQNFGRASTRFAAMKLHHTSAADARLIAQFRRNLCDQLVGNLHFGAPARAFVGGDGAKLAIVWLAT